MENKIELYEKYLATQEKNDPVTIDSKLPIVGGGNAIDISQKPDVVIEGNLTVKGKIINEEKSEGISFIKNIEIIPGTQQLIPLKGGTILNIHSPMPKPEQPVNVYDWTISLPICGTILLWAIFITIWKGHLNVEQEKNFPPLNIDIPMPKVKPPLVPPPQGRSTLKWSER